ncbi:MAG: hypothetical protein ACI9VN_002434, partial [Patescibacteria group bacterium]
MAAEVIEELMYFPAAHTEPQLQFALTPSQTSLL